MASADDSISTKEDELKQRCTAATLDANTKSRNSGFVALVPQSIRETLAFIPSVKHVLYKKPVGTNEPDGSIMISSQEDA